ncbi:MAG TPA: HlyD family efflux transporter periplasmic adaptor subunit [Bacteroidales bacterium]|nr:HlyD family efflux transporter periplasmic adaptor subunit [Bacteroidales bacterium]HRZ76208.1 HlyD family efflux transporter periplasmic adaptor subunit [Bacteroidales bacterium]
MIKHLILISSVAVAALIAASCQRKEPLPDAYGNFEAVETVLSAETSGKVLMVAVEEGDRVAQGQLLAIIDTTDLVIKQSQLQAQLASTLAQLTSLNAQAGVYEQQVQNLSKDLKRTEAMKQEGAATQKQLDDLTGGIALANRQIDAVISQRASVIAQARALEAQQAQVEEMLKRSSVRSPVSATVLNLFTRPGELAAPGKALLKLAGLDTMILRVFLSGSQLSAVQLNQEVEVLVDEADGSLRKLSGRISHIAGEAEFTPKTIQTRDERTDLVYAVEIRVKNDGRLRIGMPAEVRTSIDPSK